ncbi:CaiB/BaiF CoA-transferase family protein [Ammoniphilus sp. YIM 78166]|uniref:CaiB/BaiF CoA transferase family protein n=1 Tax=Ammoniphilus sp. YIM 78166 TaxID=1644106 RepID=UPI001430A870|nr:CaiB/BaiF CoA-transferase family protein [Ammoniphilus sp. YIM 78166]
MLRGLKVLDLSRYLPGPFASLRMAEMGAEVIKVETLPYGDPARSLIESTELLYEICNRGKKSVSLNLRSPKGVELVQRLMVKADVVLESYRPGVAEEIGLGYHKAKELNPRVIYCSLSGFGQEGSLAQMGSHDINYMALSGLLYGFHASSGQTPLIPDCTVADLAGGMAAVEGILAAYIQCLQTGKGAYLDIAITDVLASWQLVNAGMNVHSSSFQSLGGMLRQAVSYQIYETKDGRHMALGALEEKFWLNFCKAVGKEDWIAHHQAPAHASNPIYEEMQKLFRSQDFEYWSQLSVGLDACLTPVISTSEVFCSDYVRERGLRNEDFLRTSIRTSNLSPAPRLGQHTQEILSQWLDLDRDQIKLLLEEKVIQSVDS